MNVMDVNVTTKSKATKKQVFKDREPKKAKSATDWEKKMVEEVNGGNNSTYSKNTNPEKRAIHIHGGIEHNLAKYAKYYSCRNIEILRGGETTLKNDYNIKDFSRYW